MKTDRLVAIIIYLLNRETVSANELSEKFEVSLRTIQRDMESLASSGVPIMSLHGPKGGYKIMEDYKIDKTFVTEEEKIYLRKIIKGIQSSIEFNKLYPLLEKLSTDDSKYEELNESIYIDFGGLGSRNRNRKLFNLFERAIKEKKTVSFSYINSENKKSTRNIEPLSVVFKWTSWYIYGYCLTRNDYRLFRFSRIENAEITPKIFTKRNKSFEEYEREGNLYQNRKMEKLKLKFDPNMSARVNESFLNEGKITLDFEGNIIIEIYAPEDEWLYTFMLSFGNALEILEPKRIKNNLIKRAKNILKKYS